MRMTRGARTRRQPPATSPGSLEDAQDQAGGGTATLTVGNDTYSFDSALCAFDSETGNEDFTFSLSAIGDGMQLSVDSGPTYGDNITLDDIEDFDNPTVGWSSDGDGFLTIDGLDVSAEADFIDTTDETLQTVEKGELAATCPVAPSLNCHQIAAHVRTREVRFPNEQASRVWNSWWPRVVRRGIADRSLRLDMSHGLPQTGDA